MSGEDPGAVVRGEAAAQLLGVSKQRVHQLHRAGVLDRAYHPDGWAGITVESVHRRIASGPRPGPARKPPHLKAKAIRDREVVERRAATLAEALRVTGTRQLLTYEEVAEILGVSHRKVRRMVATNDLECVELAHNARRVPIEAVEALTRF